jgi:regulator of RNase E activity RraB
MKLEDLEMIELNAGEGFLALGLFVSRFAEEMDPDDGLAILCTDVEMHADQTSKDPAAMSSWADCVRAVLEERR